MHSSPWRKYKMSHIFKKRCDLCTLEENGLRTPLEAFATHPFPESLTFQIGLTLLIPPVFQSKQVPFWISFHILSFFFFLNYYCKYYFVLFTIFFIARNKLPSQVISSCWHFMSTSEVSFLATCLHGLSRVLVVLGQHCECPTHPPCPGLKFSFHALLAGNAARVLLPPLNLIQREPQGHNHVYGMWMKPARCCCLASAKMAWEGNWCTTTFLYFLLHNSWEESIHSTIAGCCWPAGREHKQSKSARYLTAVLLCIHLYHTPYAKPQSRWGGDPFKKRLSKPQRKSIFSFSVPALISYSHASFPFLTQSWGPTFFRVDAK